MKMVIVVRKDVEMGRGKLAGQVAHAACGLTWHAKSNSHYSKMLKWMETGQTKAVLRIGSESEINELMAKAHSMAMPFYPVHDAGHTQLEPGTLTCVGFGPEETETIDKLTGHLKLL